MDNETYSISSSSNSDDSGLKSGEPRRRTTTKKRDKTAAMARYYAGSGQKNKIIDIRTPKKANSPAKKQEKEKK